MQTYAFPKDLHRFCSNCVVLDFQNAPGLAKPMVFLRRCIGSWALHLQESARLANPPMIYSKGGGVVESFWEAQKRGGDTTVVSSSWPAADLIPPPWLRERAVWGDVFL